MREGTVCEGLSYCSLTIVANRFVVSLYRRLPKCVSALGVRLLKPTFPIGVVAVVYDELGRVLLLQHTYDTPIWRLPGGLMEKGETPSQTAIREVREEANCLVKPIAVVDASTAIRTFDVAVLAQLLRQEAFSPNSEIRAYRWVHVLELPDLPQTQYRFIQAALRFVDKS